MPHSTTPPPNLPPTHDSPMGYSVLEATPLRGRAKRM